MKHIALTLCLLMTAVLPAHAQDFESASIRSPSDNIYCAFTGPLEGFRDVPAVECEISEMTTKSDLPPPLECEEDWGNRIEIATKDEAYLTCYGDTLRTPEAALLPYGESFSANGLTCTSSEAGMTCRNAEGHGFSMSKTEQTMF